MSDESRVKIRRAMGRMFMMAASKTKPVEPEDAEEKDKDKAEGTEKKEPEEKPKKKKKKDDGDGGDGDGDNSEDGEKNEDAGDGEDHEEPAAMLLDETNAETFSNAPAIAALARPHNRRNLVEAILVMKQITNLRFFAAPGEEFHTKLIKAATLQLVDPNTKIYSQASSTEQELYIVLKGTVVLHQSKNNLKFGRLQRALKTRQQLGKSLSDTYGPMWFTCGLGDCFGHECVLGKSKRLSTAIVKDHAALMVISDPELIKLLAQYKMRMSDFLVETTLALLRKRHDCRTVAEQDMLLSILKDNPYVTQMPEGYQRHWLKTVKLTKYKAKSLWARKGRDMNCLSTVLSGQLDVLDSNSRPGTRERPDTSGSNGSGYVPTGKLPISSIRQDKLDVEVLSISMEDAHEMSTLDSNEVLRSQWRDLLGMDTKDRSEEDIGVMAEMMVSLKFFQQLPGDIREELSAFATYRRLEHQSIILAQGEGVEVHPEMYVIVRGNVAIRIRQDGNPRAKEYRKLKETGDIVDDEKTTQMLGFQVATLKTGDAFGEVALKAGSTAKRNATCFCSGPVDLLVINNSTFKRTLDKRAKIVFQPDLTAASMEKSCDDRTPQDLAVISRCLKSIAMFNHLPGPALKTLAREVALQVYKPGDVVIGQGQPGDQFFVVLAGTLSVHKRAQDPGKIDAAALKAMSSQDLQDEIGMCVAVLAAGDGFGEMVLHKTDAKRAATVLARTPTQLITVHRDHLMPIKHYLKQKIVFQPARFKHILKLDANIRGDEDVFFMQRFLKTIKFLSDLPDDVASDMSRHLKYVSKKKGDVLYRMGEKIDNFYIVMTGRVEMFTCMPQAVMHRYLEDESPALQHMHGSTTATDEAGAGVGVGAGGNAASGGSGDKSATGGGGTDNGTNAGSSSSGSLEEKAGRRFSGGNHKAAFHDVVMEVLPGKGFGDLKQTSRGAFVRQLTAMVAETSELISLDRFSYEAVMATMGKRVQLEIKEFLSTRPAFKTWNPTELSSCASMLKPRKFRRGEHIFKPRDRADSVFFVRSGECALYIVEQSMPSADNYNSALKSRNSSKLAQTFLSKSLEKSKASRRTVPLRCNDCSSLPHACLRCKARSESKAVAEGYREARMCPVGMVVPPGVIGQNTVSATDNSLVYTGGAIANSDVQLLELRRVDMNRLARSSVSSLNNEIDLATTWRGQREQVLIGRDDKTKKLAAEAGGFGTPREPPSPTEGEKETQLLKDLFRQQREAVARMFETKDVVGELLAEHQNKVQSSKSSEANNALVRAVISQIPGRTKPDNESPSPRRQRRDKHGSVSPPRKRIGGESDGVRTKAASAQPPLNDNMNSPIGTRKILGGARTSSPTLLHYPHPDTPQGSNDIETSLSATTSPSAVVKDSSASVVNVTSLAPGQAEIVDEATAATPTSRKESLPSSAVNSSPKTATDYLVANVGGNGSVGVVDTAMTKRGMNGSRRNGHRVGHKTNRGHYTASLAWPQAKSKRVSKVAMQFHVTGDCADFSSRVSHNGAPSGVSFGQRSFSSGSQLGDGIELNDDMVRAAVVLGVQRDQHRFESENSYQSQRTYNGGNNGRNRRLSPLPSQEQQHPDNAVPDERRHSTQNDANVIGSADSGNARDHGSRASSSDQQHKSRSGSQPSLQASLTKPHDRDESVDAWDDPGERPASSGVGGAVAHQMDRAGDDTTANDDRRDESIRTQVRVEVRSHHTNGQSHALVGSPSNRRQLPPMTDAPQTPPLSGGGSRGNNSAGSNRGLSGHRTRTPIDTGRHSTSGSRAASATSQVSGRGGQSATRKPKTPMTPPLGRVRINAPSPVTSPIAHDASDGPSNTDNAGDKDKGAGEGIMPVSLVGVAVVSSPKPLPNMTTSSPRTTSRPVQSTTIIEATSDSAPTPDSTAVVSAVAEGFDPSVRPASKGQLDSMFS